MATGRKDKIYNLAKRIFDIVCALGVGIIFFPLMALITLAIKLDSPGPAIFKHRRIGQNWKIFYLWKFRSMYENPDEYILKNKELLKEFKKKEGWKFNDASQDPRITRVGRFIRKYSFDELPNLINIFSGEMSMVGPRAYRRDLFGDEIKEQLKIYPHLENKLKIALSVKPGLTGPWQVSGRNELAWDKRVELDAKYAREKSFLTDLKILLKTPFAMLNKW